MELSTGQKERLKTMAEIAQKGEVAILEKVFELQEALAEAKSRLEYIQTEQERDKRMTVEIEQPPVDLSPVVQALEDIKSLLEEEDEEDEEEVDEDEKLDLTPLLNALQDLQSTVALYTQCPDQKDYSDALQRLLEALNRPTRDQEIIDLLARPIPTFQIPDWLVRDGRIKVEVDRTGGGIASRLHDARGVAIDPANRSNQEAILTALTQQYILQVDDEYPVTYLGEAVPGTATSSAAWRIKKIDETSSPDLSITFAGTGAFDQVWDNRASLTYA